MARHTVKVDLPTISLGKADITFKVHSDDAKSGELRISHGAVVWFPVSAKMGYRITWEKLTDWIVQNGRKCERSS